MSCQALDVPAGAQHAFIEDTARNFIPIKEKYPGVVTILIRATPPTEEEEKYVDIYAPDLGQVLHAISATMCPAFTACNERFSLNP